MRRVSVRGSAQFWPASCVPALTRVDPGTSRVRVRLLPAGTSNPSYAHTERNGRCLRRFRLTSVRLPSSVWISVLVCGGSCANGLRTWSSTPVTSKERPGRGRLDLDLDLDLDRRVVVVRRMVP